MPDPVRSGEKVEEAKTRSPKKNSWGRTKSRKRAAACGGVDEPDPDFLTPARHLIARLAVACWGDGGEGRGLLAGGHQLSGQRWLGWKTQSPREGEPGSGVLANNKQPTNPDPAATQDPCQKARVGGRLVGGSVGWEF
jgi:hypothetical protein